MTGKQLIELVMADHPDKGETHIRLLANMALGEFAAQTRLIRREAVVEVAKGILHAELPEGCIDAYALFDDAGAEVFHSAHYSFHLLPEGTTVWWVDDGRLLVGKVVQKQCVPLTEDATFHLKYYAHPAFITKDDLDAEIDLPIHLQPAIEARVKEKLSVGDPERQRYWYALWKDYIKQGKIWGRTAQDAGPYHVLIHEI